MPPAARSDALDSPGAYPSGLTTPGGRVVEAAAAICRWCPATRWALGHARAVNRHGAHRSRCLLRQCKGHHRACRHQGSRHPKAGTQAVFHVEPPGEQRADQAPHGIGHIVKPYVHRDAVSPGIVNDQITVPTGVHGKQHAKRQQAHHQPAHLRQGK